MLQIKSAKFYHGAYFLFWDYNQEWLYDMLGTQSFSWIERNVTFHYSDHEVLQTSEYKFPVFVQFDLNDVNVK